MTEIKILEEFIEPNKSFHTIFTWQRKKESVADFLQELKNQYSNKEFNLVIQRISDFFNQNKSSHKEVFLGEKFKYQIDFSKDKETYIFRVEIHNL